MHRRACVFAHYDKDDIVDEYVYYYLNELLSVVTKLVFVTVSDIEQKDIDRLEKLNIDVIKRENIGYDFYSYKVGIESLDLELYDELVICNDSVFGPLYSLTNLFDEMNSKKCDFWGITGSRQYARHLQSYFICYRRNVLYSEFFKGFWENLIVIEDKKKLIEKYEVGLSQLLYKQEFQSESFIEYHPSLVEHGLHLKQYYMPKGYQIIRLLKMPFSKYYWDFVGRGINISTSWWDIIILKHQMPFIKKSLFFDEIYKKEVLQKYEYVISSVSNYPLGLIEKHIKRVGKINEKQPLDLHLDDHLQS